MGVIRYSVVYLTTEYRPECMMCAEAKEQCKEQLFIKRRSDKQQKLVFFVIITSVGCRWCSLIVIMMTSDASNNQSEISSMEQDVQVLKTNVNQFFLIIMGSFVFCKIINLNLRRDSKLTSNILDKFYSLDSLFTIRPWFDRRMLSAFVSVTTSIQVYY